jgi:tRNA (mo5U34)-methyltransferase
LASAPVAYLVTATECNNDPSNYWIFSAEGLRRILDRTGWDILDWMTVGQHVDSDPASAEGDERAFCLVRSRVLAA